MRLLKTIFLIIVLGFLGIAVAAPVFAQIAYQGILTDASGNPLRDSTWSLTFSLHTDSTKSSLPIWNEEKSVTTKKGIFSHMLGSVTSLSALKFDEQYWLSITREGIELGQRVKLGVVPYAMRSVVADTANYIDGEHISDTSISAEKIKSGAITTEHLLARTITTDDVSDTFVAPRARYSDSSVVSSKSHGFVSKKVSIDTVVSHGATFVAQNADNQALKIIGSNIIQLGNGEYNIRLYSSSGGKLWKLGSIGHNSPYFNGYIDIHVYHANDFGILNVMNKKITINTRSQSVLARWYNLGDDATNQPVDIEVYKKPGGGANIYVRANDYSRTMIKIISSAGFQLDYSVVTEPEGDFYASTNQPSNMNFEIGTIQLNSGLILKDTEDNKWKVTIENGSIKTTKIE